MSQTLKVAGAVHPSEAASLLAERKCDVVVVEDYEQITGGVALDINMCYRAIGEAFALRIEQDGGFIKRYEEDGYINICWDEDVFFDDVITELRRQGFDVQ